MSTSWGPEVADPPTGVLEGGHKIGCGIDVSTFNGVSLTGTAGLNPSLGVIGTDVISPIPDGILPDRRQRRWRCHRRPTTG